MDILTSTRAEKLGKLHLCFMFSLVNKPAAVTRQISVAMTTFLFALPTLGML